jgi:hypothetical protein
MVSRAGEQGARFARSGLCCCSGDWAVACRRRRVVSLERDQTTRERRASDTRRRASGLTGLLRYSLEPHAGACAVVRTGAFHLSVKGNSPRFVTLLTVTSIYTPKKRPASSSLNAQGTQGDSAFRIDGLEVTARMWQGQAWGGARSTLRAGRSAQLPLHETVTWPWMA